MAEVDNHVSLKEHFDVLVKSMDRFFSEKIESINRFFLEKIDSLDKLFLSKWELLKTMIDLKVESILRSMDIAKKELDDKLVKMNEMRTQVDQMEAMFPTRTELGLTVKALEENNASLRTEVISLKGIISNLITRDELSNLIKKYDAEIKSLSESRSNVEGKDTQKATFIDRNIQVLAMIFSALAVALALIAIFRG